jgi:hypothetical protein
MVQLQPQPTRFARLVGLLAAGLFGGLGGSWRRRSALLLALLLGFYSGGNITAFVVVRFPGGRPGLVLALVLLLELVVRIRTRVLPPLAEGRPAPFGWMLADNLRVGLVYSVVLEAFKLGT